MLIHSVFRMAWNKEMYYHFFCISFIRKFKKTKRDLLDCWTQKCHSWEDGCRCSPPHLLPKNVQSVLQSYFTHCVVDVLLGLSQ